MQFDDIWLEVLVQYEFGGFFLDISDTVQFEVVILTCPKFSILVNWRFFAKTNVNCDVVQSDDTSAFVRTPIPSLILCRVC